MKQRNLLAALAGCLLTGALATYAAPPLINYQGRIVVGTTNFNSPPNGQFKFALVDGGVNQNVQATAHVLAGGQVFDISVTTGGSGYVSAPAVTIIDATGTGATAVATVTNGAVSSIQVTSGGSGYSTQATATIAPPPPNISYTYFWRNSGPGPIAGEPPDAVALPVVKGLYSVLLGDTMIPNMAAFPGGLSSIPDLRLRVWFSDDGNSFQLLSPDQRLAPAAYLADGSVRAATIEDQAITTAKIADDAIDASKVMTGAITADAILSGAINVSHLGVPASPMTGQVLGYNGTDIEWMAGGAGAGWSLSGNAGTDPANFLGTTDTRDLIFKTDNLERMRLTAGGDLVLQRPAEFPTFNVQNGLGVYGNTGALGDGRDFANINVLGPVLYGEGGGGLGTKSQTNQETLALRWTSSGVIVTGALSASGAATFSGGAAVTGNLTTSGNAGIAGNLTCAGSVFGTGAIGITGSGVVSGVHGVGIANGAGVIG